MRSVSEFVASVARFARESFVKRTRDGRGRDELEQEPSKLTREGDAASKPVTHVDLRTVSDVMSAPPESVDAKTPVREAARIMQRERIGDVLVLSDNQDLIGIVTDRDIAIRVVAEHLDSLATTVEQIMSPIEASIRPTATVAEALDLMRRHEFRRLPVIAKGMAVGVVTLGDLARSNEAGITLAQISEAPAND